MGSWETPDKAYAAYKIIIIIIIILLILMMMIITTTTTIITILITIMMHGQRMHMRALTPSMLT